MSKFSKVVLVIERDHELRVQIRSEIEQSGHFVISATSGSEALSLLKKVSAPSLILLNQDISDMSGDDLIRSIRQILANENIPISQINVSEDTPRLKGTCCTCQPGQLQKIINWLDTGSVDDIRLISR